MIKTTKFAAANSLDFHLQIHCIFVANFMENLLQKNKRILDRVRRTVFAHEKKKIRFTFSGGIACSSEVPGSPPPVEDLLDLADKRLYEAKAAGRDRCMWA